jgi:hypothetical protein
MHAHARTQAQAHTRTLTRAHILSLSPSPSNFVRVSVWANNRVHLILPVPVLKCVRSIKLHSFIHTNIPSRADLPVSKYPLKKVICGGAP